MDQSIESRIDKLLDQVTSPFVQGEELILLQSKVSYLESIQP